MSPTCTSSSASFAFFTSRWTAAQSGGRSSWGCLTMTDRRLARRCSRLSLSLAAFFCSGVALGSPSTFMDSSWSRITFAACWLSGVPSANFALMLLSQIWSRMRLAWSRFSCSTRFCSSSMSLKGFPLPISGSGSSAEAEAGADSGVSSFLPHAASTRSAAMAANRVLRDPANKLGMRPPGYAHLGARTVRWTVRGSKSRESVCCVLCKRRDFASQSVGKPLGASMANRLFCLFVALASVALLACSNKNDAQEQREAEAQVAEQVSAGPAALPTMETDPGDSGSDASAGNSEATMNSESGAAPAVTAHAEFDVSSVTPTTASLPPFPFFKDPEGIENNLKGPDAVKSFDRHGFLAGGRYVTQEGREALFQYNLENPDTGRSYSEIEFLRNYENAIAALGGKKISAVQFTPEVVAAAGGRDQIEKHWAA